MNDLPRIQALRCFITVAREGTVSRAAALLHLTQPAVSLQLKGLEESIGLQLFNRTPGGFTLTEAGVALLPLAHKAVSASSDFRTTAASQHKTEVFLRYGMSDDVLTQIGKVELDVGYYIDAPPPAPPPFSERTIG